MGYIECQQCGKRALSVATRCPHCGQDFPAQPFPASGSKPDPYQLRRALAVGGALVALAVTLAVTTVLVKQRAGSRVAAPPVTTRLEPQPIPPDSTASLGPASAGDSAPPAAPPPSVAPPPPRPGSRRYARTWVNVRGARSGAAPAVGLLRPGDAVLVDSLRGGWYRVLVNDRTLGYVDRSYLETVPPPSGP